MNHRKPIAAALLTLFASPLPLLAQQTSSSLPEIVIQGAKNDFAPGAVSVSKLPADPHDIAQSVTVVNKALMQSQGANSLADALRNVSGITLGGAEGGQIGNNVNLNGFSARTDIYLDGFRDRGQYYRDTFALDSIEVLMGPSSMLFGRGSTGGVINQVTKKPILKQQTEIGGSVTSNGLVRATVDYNTPTSDTSAVRILAMGQSGDATTRDQTKLQDFGFAPSVKFGIGTATEITLSALLQHNHDMPDYGLGPLNGAPVNVDHKTAYGYNDDHTDSDIASLNSTIIHKLSSEVTLRNQTQFNYVKTSARETAPNTIGTVSANGFTALSPAGISSLPLSSLYERLQSHDRDIRDYSFFNQTELVANLTAGGFKHNLLAGLELGHDGYDNQNFYRNGTCNGKNLNAAGTTAGYVACVPLLNPNNGDSPAAVPTTLGNRAGGSANTVATYVNDTMELNPEFKLAGGLRYDRYTAGISNSINASNTTGSTTLAGAKQAIGFTSVRLGGIWAPEKTQSYYVSYGTSFNPSLEQLTGTTGQQNLDPEKNRSYELGGKWDLADGNLALNSALFQVQKENARSLISAGVYELDGTVRVNGFRAGATGRVNKELQLALNYTYLDAKIVGASALDGTLGKTPANTPKNTLTAWTIYEPAPHWEMGGGPVYMSERFASNTNVVRVGGYTRWDATAAYKQPKYELRLNVFNLTDKMYYDALIPSDGGRSVPGTSRAAMISFTYRM
ncbi:TonB-dependent siderophore receptor [Undibacterium sp. RTI2.1]|uniref:TonB-dependent receptor n=1 Tax=unclassified Undibacterium TaxID=2630295 RepID=UPI002B228F5B|nr:MULTISPECIES: TonB-dependent siderophore receptor [unclassified Undibacterium]MEB0032794.1 TonB-dependent siderophore receptor [Undibacterium sp. RTI2.1]MEB0118533.1 TonB-dependent siderophore receptor [Undibacterium sp. RTI2.2]